MVIKRALNGLIRRSVKLGNNYLDRSAAKRDKIDVKFQVDSEIRTLIEKQNSCPEEIEKRTNYDIRDLIPFIPDEVNNIIDLGCGTGRLSIGLNKCLPELNAKYWLLDGDVGSLDCPIYWETYNDDKPRFYNVASLTKRMCDINGLKNYEFIKINDDFSPVTMPEKSEFLFSNRSIGWHFPLKTYEDIFPKILKDKAICVFTWRKGTDTGAIPSCLHKIAEVKESYQDRPVLVTIYLED